MISQLDKIVISSILIFIQIFIQLDIYDFRSQIQYLFVILRRFWLTPIGKSLGIKSTKAKPPVPNSILEDAYNKSAKLGHKTVSRFNV